MSRLPVQLILIGPPGAGKGTQAVRLARRLGLAAINPGRILREAAVGESPTSREIRERMAAGQLVEDQVVDRLVRERLEVLSPGEGVHPRRISADRRRGAIAAGDAGAPRTAPTGSVGRMASGEPGRPRAPTAGSWQERGALG
jgi:cytidylate kinase